MQARKQIIVAAHTGDLPPPFHCVDFGDAAATDDTGDGQARRGIEFINPGPIYRANERAWRTFFVEWLGKINVRNAGLDWWAYTSTAKNMLSSDLGNQVFQLLALREIVLAGNFQKLCVTGASPEQAAVFSNWLRRACPDIDVHELAPRRRAAMELFFAPFRLIYQLASVWSGFRRNSRTHAESGASKTVCFFTYIDSALKPGVDIYFGPLESLLKQREPGLDVIYAAYVYIPYQARCEDLQQMPGKYLPIFVELAIGDFLWVLCNSLMSMRVAGYNLHTDLELDIGLAPLLRRALLTDAGFRDHVFNLLVYRAMLRFARKYRPARFIYPFENKPLEKMMLLALRQASPATKITGYQHTSITPRHATLLFAPGEASITPLPDQIVTAGTVTRKFLEDHGNYPPGIFRTGSALRQTWQENPVPAVSRAGKPKILLALSSSTRELVRSMQFFRQLQETGCDFELGIRPHPEFPLGNLPPLLIEWVAGHARDFSGSRLTDNLAWCDMTAYVSSTVALETLMAGKPVVNFCIDDVIQPDPVIGDAPLHWRAEDPAEMARVLQQIQALPAADFHRLSSAARAYINDYLRPVSAECAARFLEDAGGT